MAEFETKTVATTGEEEFVFEQLVLTVKEVFVYKVPPLKSASGHRAEEWGLESPLFTGLLKVFQQDKKLRIVLFSYKDPQSLSTAEENLVKFGECPIEVKPKEDIIAYVDAVIDSSRYYVIRLKDPNSNRHVNIGIGFREREVAFDFKNALNEYVKYIDRMALAEKMANAVYESVDNCSGGKKEVDDDTSLGPLVIMKDMSLKEGEKITVKVNKKRSDKEVNGGDSSSSNSNRSSSSNGSGGLLKPPPPAGTVIQSHKSHPPAALSPPSAQAVTNKDADINNDDDWDDFQGST